MTRRRIGVLCTIILLPIGCGPSAPPPGKGAKTAVAQTKRSADAENGGLVNVTLYLAGMNRRLKILWGDWPNEVKQALAELDGVATVEDEWERELESDEDLDLLFVTYNAERISVARLIEKIKEFGYDAVVKDE